MHVFQYYCRFNSFSEPTPEETIANYPPTAGRISECSSISHFCLSTDMDSGVPKEFLLSDQNRNITDCRVKTDRRVHSRNTPEIICLPSNSAPSDSSSFQEPSHRIFESQPTERFQNAPAMVNCTSCGAQVLTSIEYRVSSVNWALAGLLCAFGCHFGCCLVPFFINSIKDRIHVCPLCKTQLGKYCKV